MYDTPSTHPQAGIPTCDRCGERPGRVRMVFANGGQRGEAVLCEQCAAGVMSARGELPQPGAARTQRASETPALDEFGRDLTAEAREGGIDPVIGRDDEIEQTVEILARRRKNNAVLIGEPGVGKTAIVEGLARRIAEGDVPETLRDARIVTVDLSGMIAGAQFRGQFEQRFKAALQEAVDADERSGDEASGRGSVRLVRDHLAAAGAVQIERRRGRHAVEPRAQVVRVAQPRVGAQRAQQRVLEHVLGGLLVREPAGVGEQLVAVALDQRPERGQGDGCGHAPTTWHAGPS
jgi:AAA ATPase domain